MTANTGDSSIVTFARWVEGNRHWLIKGYMSAFAKEPYDYSMTDQGIHGYEIGRQLGLSVMYEGKTRGYFIRKAPKQEHYVWVKTKLKELEVHFWSLNPENRGNFFALNMGW